MAETTKTGLDALVDKYSAGKTPQSRTYEAFDRSTGSEQVQRRLSYQPSTGGKTKTLGELHAEMRSIELKVARDARKYGRLTASLKALFGKEGIYSPGLWLKLKYHTVMGNEEKADAVVVKACQQRGDKMGTLVDEMAKVAEEQHQTAIEGANKSKGLQVNVVAHLRYLDQELITGLRSGFVRDAGYAQKMKVVDELEADLKEVTDSLGQKEDEVRQAKAAGDLEKVQALTDDMGKILDIKYAILNGKLAAQGEVSELRRKILDSAEQTKSAKSATAAEQLNYETATALIDIWNRNEIKYRYLKMHMIPVFKGQAELSMSLESAIRGEEAFADMVDSSNRLMRVMADLTEVATERSVEFFQKDTYSLEEARAMAQHVREVREKYNKLEMEWAEFQRTVDERKAASAPHYTRHT